MNVVIRNIIIMYLIYCTRKDRLRPKELGSSVIFIIVNQVL